MPDFFFSAACHVIICRSHFISMVGTGKEAEGVAASSIYYYAVCGYDATHAALRRDAHAAAPGEDGDFRRPATTPVSLKATLMPARYIRA